MRAARLGQSVCVASSNPLAYIKQANAYKTRVGDLEDALSRLLAAIDGHPVADNHPAIAHAYRNAAAVLQDRVALHQGEVIE
jgi:hypothetical protein